MIDLRNLNGGKKLIKEIMSSDSSSNKPWSKTSQYKSVKKQKNVHTAASRPKKNF